MLNPLINVNMILSTEFKKIRLMTRSIYMGYLMLALAQTAISGTVVASKSLLSSLSMFTLLSGRFGISTIVLGLMLLVSKQKFAEPTHPEGKLNKNDWHLLLWHGIFGSFLFNIFFVWGLPYTTATAAGVVSSILPALIAVFSVWLLKERLTKNMLMALVLAILGILLMNAAPSEGDSSSRYQLWGNFLIFLSMLPEAWYSIISRKVAGRINPLASAFSCNLIGFIGLTLCGIVTGTITLEGMTSANLMLLIIAAICSLFFFWGWGWGLTRVKASIGGLFSGVAPIATTLLAVLFLEEHLSLFDAAGVFLVIISIVLGAIPQSVAPDLISLDNTENPP